MSKIIIALGGNALGTTPLEQQELIKKATREIVKLIKLGHEIILSHGNGPQVGIINSCFSNSSIDMPLAESTAMSQGYIGYHLEKGLRESLLENKIDKEVVTVITQITVDENDPSFNNPTKPIGPFYSKEELYKLKDETYTEDPLKGYRKVVASPIPKQIIEINAIKTLYNNGYIVICCGGGGIPISNQKIGAVIDKDLASSLLASQLESDILLILTDIEQVELFYGTEKAIKLNEVSSQQMKEYIKENHFAKGSMLPKITAAIEFVEQTNKIAIITSLNNVSNALTGNNVTKIRK